MGGGGKWTVIDGKLVGYREHRLVKGVITGHIPIPLSNVSAPGPRIGLCTKNPPPRVLEENANFKL